MPFTAAGRCSQRPERGGAGAGGTWRAKPGVPVYKLFGGPTRIGIRMYKHAGDRRAQGMDRQRLHRLSKVGVAGGRPAHIIENKALLTAPRHFAACAKPPAPK